MRTDLAPAVAAAGPAADLAVEVIETPELGDRTYVAHDGTTAVAVDVQRDVDRVEAVLEARGLALAAVVETHVHNDYVTGGHELARRHGADYLVSAEDDVTFARRPVGDGSEESYGGLRLRVVATPGHTDHHLSYLLATDDRPGALFTGGSLLFGSVGRTDLLGAHLAAPLARAQHRSVGRLAAELPAATAVLPTHGFGSFCSAGPTSGASASTIGEELVRNPALLETDEDRFVAALLAGLGPVPAYYAHMAAANRAGPGPAHLDPAPLTVADVLARLQSGGWVVDLRDRRAFAARHLVGTVAVEPGNQFSTYVGWLAPWGAPLALLGPADVVAEATRQLTRIGYDAVGAASATDALASSHPTGSYRTVTFADVPSRPADSTLLDVRTAAERATGRLDGSVHLPVADLLAGLDTLPRHEIWVHCVSGFRASTAASVLARAGHTVVLVDDHVDHARSLPTWRP